MRLPKSALNVHALLLPTCRIHSHAVLSAVQRRAMLCPCLFTSILFKTIRISTHTHECTRTFYNRPNKVACGSRSFLAGERWRACANGKLEGAHAPQEPRVCCACACACGETLDCHAACVHIWNACTSARLLFGGAATAMACRPCVALTVKVRVCSAPRSQLAAPSKG